MPLTEKEKKKKRREEQLGFSEAELEKMREERRRTPLAPDKPPALFRGPLMDERKTYSIGGVKLTKEEYDAAKRKLGFEAPGPTLPLTPAAEEALKVVREQERAAKGLLPTEEVEELKGEARIEELKEKVLRPDVSLRYITPGEEAEKRVDVGQGYSVAVTDEQDTINQTKKQIGAVVSKNMNSNSNIIRESIRMLTLGLTTKAAKVSLSVVDSQMQNMEGALVNHKEGAADVIVALQSGGYTPWDAMEDTNNMVQDVDDVEAMMKNVYLFAPSVWAEMKGWEYVSRLQKIRRAIIARQAQILNIAETGAPIDPGGMALALSNLQVSGS